MPGFLASRSMALIDCPTRQLHGISQPRARSARASLRPRSSGQHLQPQASCSSRCVSTHATYTNAPLLPRRSRARCRPRAAASAAPESPADYAAYKATTQRINSIRTLHQMAAYLRSTQMDANVAASALFRSVAMWQRHTDSPAWEGRDADHPDVQAWQELQVVLPQAAVEYMPMFPVESRVALAVACAQLMWVNPEAAALYDAAADSIVADFDAQVKPGAVGRTLMLTACAYATAGHYNAKLMDWLGTTTTANMDSFNTIDDVTNMLHAFYELRHQHPAFLASSRAWLLPRLLDPASSADVAPDALVAVGQAYATFEAGDLELYSALFGALEGCRQLKMLNPTAGSCLQVLYVMVRHLGVQLPRKVGAVMTDLVKTHPEEVIRPSFAASFDPAYVQAMLEAGVTSMEELRERNVLMGMEVQQALEFLGLPFERNLPAAEGFILAHFITQYHGAEVTIQLCDRDSFTTKPYYRFKGTVLNEMRALEKLGHRVVALPWFEWARLETDADRARHLVECVRKAAEVQQQAPGS